MKYLLRHHSKHFSCDCLIWNPHFTLCKVDSVIIPISPMKKLEPKEVKSFAPSHRASECGAGSLEGETS